MGKNMKRRLDIQAYILPNMADSKCPQIIEKSVQMIKELATSGITDIFGTPKVNDSNVQAMITSIGMG